MSNLSLLRFLWHNPLCRTERGMLYTCNNNDDDDDTKIINNNNNNNTN